MERQGSHLALRLIVVGLGHIALLSLGVDIAQQIPTTYVVVILVVSLPIQVVLVPHACTSHSTLFVEATFLLPEQPLTVPSLRCSHTQFDPFAHLLLSDCPQLEKDKEIHKNLKYS
jgi:hypothetical protein